MQVAVAEEAVIGGSETLTRMTESVAIHCQLFDRDGDGLLSVDDYRHWTLAWGLAFDAERNFQQFDLDGDGYLRQTEIAEYLRQFHFSNDPEAPGNYFYGEFRS